MIAPMELGGGVRPQQRRQEQPQAQDDVAHPRCHGATLLEHDRRPPMLTTILRMKLV